MDGNDPDVALVDLDAEDGTTGRDVISRLRREPVHVQIIATSALDRRAARAEELAHDDVLFLPKPMNLAFAVGMIGGCVQGARSRSEAAVRRLGAGAVLFREGDPGDRLFVVQEGSFSIRRTVEGEEVEIDTVAAGELLGEVSFFGNGPRTVTAVAATDARVVDLDGAALRGYLARQPRWLTTVLTSFVANTMEDEAAIARLKRDLAD
jgi:hypothetical protein